MAWTSPMTFVANTVLTAAQLNTHLRDNLMETAPAKATTPSSYFVTSSPNSIAERIGVRQTLVDVVKVTGSTYSDPEAGSTGPQVTAVTGSRALVIWGAEIWRQDIAGSDTNNTSTIRVTVDVTGASDIPGTDTRSLCNATPGQGRHQSSHAVWYDSLTPGENTFTCKYRVSTYAAFADSRRLIVLPY